VTTLEQLHLYRNSLDVCSFTVVFAVYFMLCANILQNNVLVGAARQPLFSVILSCSVCLSVYVSLQIFVTQPAAG